MSVSWTFGTTSISYLLDRGERPQSKGAVKRTVVSVLVEAEVMVVLVIKVGSEKRPRKLEAQLSWNVCLKLQHVSVGGLK